MGLLGTDGTLKGTFHAIKAAKGEVELQLLGGKELHGTPVGHPTDDYVVIDVGGPGMAAALAAVTVAREKGEPEPPLPTRHLLVRYAAIATVEVIVPTEEQT